MVLIASSQISSPLERIIFLKLVVSLVSFLPNFFLYSIFLPFEIGLAIFRLSFRKILFIFFLPKLVPFGFFFVKLELFRFFSLRLIYLAGDSW